MKLFENQSYPGNIAGTSIIVGNYTYDPFTLQDHGFDADYPPGQIINDTFSHQSFVSISIEFVCNETSDSDWRLQELNEPGLGPKPLNFSFYSVSQVASQIVVVLPFKVNFLNDPYMRDNFTLKLIFIKSSIQGRLS